MLKSEFQHQFWVTKKAVQRKLGTKEDENIVASDGELDSKIELFQSVTETSRQLYRIIDQYQERVCILAQEENSLGKFLREVSKENPTTGKLLSNTGKAVSYCGQQRITIRVPLLRLHHDVHTFKGRAIADTHNTIQSMEKERTEYRAALSWMKSVSIQLDPDTGRGLEKFRKAQRHVKTAKTKFDKYTLDCLEKIDLLAAARCNMFSHALVGYQNALLLFAKKSSETYKTTLKSLSKDPHYNFSILRELTQANPNARDQEDGDQADKPVDNDQMLFFQDDYKDDTTAEKQAKLQTHDNILPKIPTDVDLLAGVSEQQHNANAEPENVASSTDLLGLALGEEFSDFLSAPAPFMPSTLLAKTESMQLSFNELPNLAANEKPSEKSSNDIFGSFLQGLSKNSQACTSSPGNNKDDNSKRLQKDGKSSKDLSGWYQLFAELDPLSNPDAIPSKADVPNNSSQA
ncbi:islet cell autoantigen 1 [Sabethes cyaneus]|uniref:islet cell autoantigen 1 n=1 Tax=Sabethes cyaneus TaxID=53552 RepID=UPI00237E0779|nr:islet cell autoantigen 1 [Sabethes cyaneus]